MDIDKKKKFICPATGLTADAKHCESYGNGSNVSDVSNGCMYFKKNKCVYEKSR